MPAIFSKNCVLSGEVDCYCLVCCKHLPAEHDVLVHIQDSEHKHNLSAHPYLDQFQEDRIRKVSGVYLCEVCDTTLPTAAKVRLHVTEHTHLECKRGRMLTRTRKCIVFHENIVITENAWNGLIDDTCVLCNVEFQHDSTHTAEQSHVLNLIKSRVTITDNYDIYRQVYGLHQCLTCNKVLPDDDITQHLDSPQHKSLLTKCDPQDDVINIKDERKDLVDKLADLFLKEVGSQSNGDVTNKQPTKDRQCNIVDGANNVTLNSKSVPPKGQKKPTCSVAVTKNVESFAKQHGLSVINNNSKVYCDTCDTSVTATIDSIKEHVTRTKHTDKLTKQEPKQIEKVRFMSIFTELAVFWEGIDIYWVLNNTYVVNAIHILCFTRVNKDTYVSKLSEKVYTSDTSFTHALFSQHDELFNKAYIITSLKDELVRQLKPKLYDCIYCGHMVRHWDDMLKHLNTDEHKASKHKSEHLASLCRRGIIKTINSPGLLCRGFI